MYKSGDAAMPIRLVVVDIDGCLTPGEGSAAPLDVLREIQDINARSRTDPAVPSVTLCTGRQQPFVELMCQLIGAYRPAIFENGAGLYDPEVYEFLAHPQITPDMIQSLHSLKPLIEEHILRKRVAKMQPGKEFSLSLYPAVPHTVAETAALMRNLCDRNGLRFFMDESIMCVNVLFPGIDKGAGVRWLASHLGMPLADIAGVGDADGDLAYLNIVGFPAAPANAAAAVRARAAFVAPSENGHGTLEILREIIRRNKAP
jgi:hypothetical protein